MTAAKVMDIISRLPECSGQAADAVSAKIQVKWKMLSNYWKLPKSECPDIWIRLHRHKWPKSWQHNSTTQEQQPQPLPHHRTPTQILCAWCGNSPFNALAKARVPKLSGQVGLFRTEWEPSERVNIVRVLRKESFEEKGESKWEEKESCERDERKTQRRG